MSEAVNLSLLHEENQVAAITLNNWFEIWINIYKKDHIKPTSIDTYRFLYNRHLKNAIGFHGLAEFRPLHIQKLYNDFIEKGYSANYLNTLHTMLNNLFKTAMINELIYTNPCSLISRPSTEPKKRTVLSLDEQKLILAKIKESKFIHTEPIITTLLGTGLRVGELLALRWSDINITNDPKAVCTLSVRQTLVRIIDENTHRAIYQFQTPKTKNSIRTIPLQGSVVDALNRQSKLQDSYKKRKNWSPAPDSDDLIFSGKKGQPQWRSTIASNINTVINSINLDLSASACDESESIHYIGKISPHIFRHTFATRCLEAGIPPKVVQEWLGHSSIKMTLDLYTHVTNTLSEKYMEILERYVTNH